MKNPIEQPLHPNSLLKCMLIGGLIAFSLISIFVFGVDTPDPQWPLYWQAKPLILTPCSGLAAGILYYMMDNLRYYGGWRRLLANILSILGGFIIIWLGVVLGLNGTMWD